MEVKTVVVVIMQFSGQGIEHPALPGLHGGLGSSHHFHPFATVTEFLRAENPHSKSPHCKLVGIAVGTANGETGVGIRIGDGGRVGVAGGDCGGVAEGVIVGGFEGVTVGGCGVAVGGTHAARTKIITRTNRVFMSLRFPVGIAHTWDFHTPCRWDFPPVWKSQGHSA